MSPLDHRPQFEMEPSGFVAVNRQNMLAALSTVLPAETIAKVKAGIETKVLQEPTGQTIEENESNGTDRR